MARGRVTTSSTGAWPSDLPEGGSARECAELICRVIRERCEAFFEAHPGPRGVVSCGVSVGDDGVKIAVRILDEAGAPCPLEIAYLSASVECPPERPQIDDVEADVVVPDRDVTITGAGFGDDADDLSVSLLLNGGFPMRAVTATDQQVTVRAAAVPGKPIEPGAAPIMIVPGIGATRDVDPG